ncbi:MAG TPA: UvrD-helicase domain-containing protein [Candidatus Saccharimonadales bacterium]|nr:UvrD-helicase domain-containing protein [Candidatus Saccharimonadales bacterium]
MLDGLNEQQLEAARHTDGPLLILAGAGSGKTKTLTHRIANLIHNHGVNPANILAVTFTNKAAKEMRVRLGQLLGVDGEQRSFMPWMGTFHSICVRLLRQDGGQIGIPSNFVILDESDRLSLIKQAMKDLAISEKNYTPRSMASLISSAKNEGIGPDEYAATARMPLNKTVASIYPAYENLRRNAKALDFDDLLGETVRLLKTVAEIRSKWRQQFAYVLVDEYQDTNAVQYQLVKLLLNERHNLCVVGDDWQSIYSWRGADFTNILNFERDFKDVKVIKLEKNYRSTKPILEAAHNVITKNQQRTSKKLVSQLGDGEPVQILHVQSEIHEAEAIVTRIKTAVDLRLRRYDDFAVLYRTNAQSRALEEIFMRYGLPYKIIGGTRFYDRAEVKDVMAYLRLLYQPADRASFLRIVNLPARGIGKVSLSRFLDWADGSGQAVAQALNQVELCPGLPPKALGGLKDLGNILNDLTNNQADSSLAELINAVIKRTGYLNYLDDGTPRGEDKVANVKELLSDAEQRPDTGLGEYLEEVALVSSQDSEASSAVTLMTLHAAKGLEFPVVFMVGMEEGLFPSGQSVYEADKLEEERRLCYVGMTRAREELFLTTASSRLTFGARSYNPPSRFLADMEVAEASPMQINLPRPGSLTSEPRLVMDEVDLAVGDKVKHSLFGVGTVTDLDGNNVAVAFAGKGVKKLNTAFAPLEKL